MPRLPWLLSVLACLFLPCGCKPNIVAGGIPRTTHYATIVSLSPGATEIIASEPGGRSLLIGRTSACNWPARLVPSIDVVASVKPNYELITKKHPSLIVWDRALYNSNDQMKVMELSTPLVALDGFPKHMTPDAASTIDNFMVQLRDLGDLIGWETPLSELTDKIYSARAESQANAPSPKPKVAVLMPGGSSENMIAGLRTFQADIVRAAGGEPVGPGGNSFASIGAEALVQLNPDIIITAGSPGPLAADARLQTIKALKSKHVYGIDQDILLRHGFRVDIAITRVHEALVR